MLALACRLLGPSRFARPFLRLLLGGCRCSFGLRLRALLAGGWLFSWRRFRLGFALLRLPFRFWLRLALRLGLSFTLGFRTQFGRCGFSLRLFALRFRSLLLLFRLWLWLRLRLFCLLALLAQQLFRVLLLRLRLRLRQYHRGLCLGHLRLRPCDAGITGGGRLHRDRQRHEGENHPRQQCVLLQHRCFLICQSLYAAYAATL